MKRMMMSMGAGICAVTVAGSPRVDGDGGGAEEIAGGRAILEQVSRIEKDVVVNAEVREVWECWSTGHGMERFFAPRCMVEPVPGGRLEVWFQPDAPAGERGAEGLKVLSVLPGEMISFEWSAPPKFAHARPQRTWVVVTLTAVDAERTIVRLIHLGWDEVKAKNPGHETEWDEVRAYFEQAWPYVLGNLQKVFEKDLGRDAADEGTSG